MFSAATKLDCSSFLGQCLSKISQSWHNDDWLSFTAVLMTLVCSTGCIRVRNEKPDIVLLGNSSLSKVQTLCDYGTHWLDFIKTNFMDCGIVYKGNDLQGECLWSNSIREIQKDELNSCVIFAISCQIMFKLCVNYMYLRIDKAMYISVQSP